MACCHFVIWLILPVFDKLGQNLYQHTTKLHEVANILWI